MEGYENMVNGTYVDKTKAKQDSLQFFLAPTPYYKSSISKEIKKDNIQTMWKKIKNAIKLIC